MGARELLTELAGLGLRVSADGGNLVIRPASALSQDHREMLRAFKAEVLEALAPPPMVRRLMGWGWPEADARAVAHLIEERDAADDRRLCVECRHYWPERCKAHHRAGLPSPTIGKQWAVLPQRCTGFA